MDSIAYLKFSRAEQFMIYLGGHDPGHVEGFFLGFFNDDSRNALRFGFLFGSELEIDHKIAVIQKKVKTSKPTGAYLQHNRFPPTFQLLTQLYGRAKKIIAKH